MKLTNIPAKKRIQDPNYSDWVTLRYDDLGEAEILASYHTRQPDSLAGSGGGIIAEINGVREFGYLSHDDGRHHVFVVSDYGHMPELADVALTLREGKSKTVRIGGLKYIVSRLPHPTDQDTVVIGLR